MPRLKKFFLSFFAFLLLIGSYLSLAAKPAAAQGTWFNPSYDEWYLKVNDSPESEIFGERYTAAQVSWVVWGFKYFIDNLGGNNNPAMSCILRAQKNGESVEEKCKDEVGRYLTAMIGTEENYASSNPLKK